MSSTHNARLTLSGTDVHIMAHTIEPHAWNGWHRPLFTREQGDDLAAQLRADSDPDLDTVEWMATAPADVDAEAGDGYLITDAQDPTLPAWLPGQDGPGGVRLYPIGAGWWCWEDDSKTNR